MRIEKSMRSTFPVCASAAVKRAVPTRDIALTPLSTTLVAEASSASVQSPPVVPFAPNVSPTAYAPNSAENDGGPNGVSARAAAHETAADISAIRTRRLLADDDHHRRAHQVQSAGTP